MDGCRRPGTGRRAGARRRAPRHPRGLAGPRWRNGWPWPGSACSATSSRRTEPTTSAARSTSARSSRPVETMGAAESTEPVETPDRAGAFPRLSEGQVEALSARGHRSPTTAGDRLYRAGDSPYDFFVILKGLVSAHADTEGAEPPVAVHGPRRFLGELSLLTGQPAFYTTVVQAAGEVLRVEPDVLRQLVGEDS